MNLRVRRACLEDVGALTRLWDSMRFDSPSLAKRITEFQVAETEECVLIGAVGLQILERQGQIHSEAFTDFALAEAARPLLWDRLNSVARNHGLLRLWTREQAPFWNHCGLVTPDKEALEKLPSDWGGGSAQWLTLKLRDDLDTIVSLDREFSLFMQGERQKTQRALQRAKWVKVVAAVVAFGVLLAVLGAAFLLARKQFLLNSPGN